MRPILAAIAAFSFLLSACATNVNIPGEDPQLLEFLRDGATTRDEVLLKLGQPSATFETERVLTYRIRGEARQGYVVGIPLQGSWQGVTHSLVLIFDANGVLQKHSLVSVQ